MQVVCEALLGGRQSTDVLEQVLYFRRAQLSVTRHQLARQSAHDQAAKGLRGLQCLQIPLKRLSLNRGLGTRDQIERRALAARPMTSQAARLIDIVTCSPSIRMD